MSRTNTRWTNPSFGTPVPRVGQRGWSSYDTVGNASAKAKNASNIAYARRFNLWVIE